MTRTQATRILRASPEQVFEAISNVENLPQTNPEIVTVELLTLQRSGKGTRFRETRRMGKRQLVGDYEITAYDAPKRMRVVTDNHGTIWDTVFHVRPVPEGAELELVMDARAHSLVPRLLNPLMKGLFAKGLEAHLDALQDYLE